MVWGGENLLLSVVDVVRMTLAIGVGVLAFMFVVRFMRKRVAAVLRRGWFSSALLSSFAVFFVLVFLAYVVPWYQSVEEFNASGAKLPASQFPTSEEQLGIYWVAFVRILSTSVIVTVLSLPLLFIGSFLLSHLVHARKLSLAIAYPLTALGTAFFSVVLWMAFPFVLTSLFYMLYWGGLG